MHGAIKAMVLALPWFVGNAMLLLLYLRAPQWRRRLFVEDGIIETTTALLFLAASILGLVFWITGSRAYRWLLAVASGLGLLGFLDEISFGARFFGWSMPEMRGGGEFDGAHDLVIVLARSGSHSAPITIAMIGIAILGLGLWCARRWYAHLRSLTHNIVSDPAYTAMALFVGGVAIATIVDLDIGLLGRLGPVEETLEMNAAVALAVAIVIAGSRSRKALVAGDPRRVD
jgi:hypothetical protein